MRSVRRRKPVSRKPTRAGRQDPTRTTLLRRAFARELAKRYQRLRLAVYELIVTEDALGPGDDGNVTIIPTTNQRFRYDTNPRKVERFRAWLRQQMDSTLAGDRLLEEYIARGYQKGLGRGFDDAKRSGAVVPRGTQAPGTSLAGGLADTDDGGVGSREAFLRSQAYNPATLGAVKLLAGRTFAELEGVNARMGAAMSRILTDGLVRGWSKEEIAAHMADEVGIAAQRAKDVAHNELLHAFNESHLDALEALGVGEVQAVVEWHTQDDGKVCAACKALEGVVFKVQEARGLLPRHNRCRCAWTTAWQGRAKAIDLPKNQRKRRQALGKSVRAETGERSNRAAAGESSWPGADLVGNAEMMVNLPSSHGPALLEFSRLLATLSGNADWQEDEHPRDERGRFGAKAGGLEAAHAHFQKSLTSPEPASLDHTIGVLSKLTVKEIGELKRRLGVRASGRKAELVRKVAERFLARKGTAPAPPAAPAMPEEPVALAGALHGLQGEYAKGLTWREGKEVYDYAGTTHQQINRTLWDKEEIEPRTQERIDTLDRLIANAPPLPAPATVWRDAHYMAWASDTLDESLRSMEGTLEPGKVVEFPGYSSTTADPGILGLHEKTAPRLVFKIKAKAGLYVPSVMEAHLTKPADKDPEKELLLARGGKFRVVGKGRQTFAKEGKSAVHTVYELEQL